VHFRSGLTRLGCGVALAQQVQKGRGGQGGDTSRRCCGQAPGTVYAAGTISRCSPTDQKAVSETAVRRPPNQLRPDRREREVP